MVKRLVTVVIIGFLVTVIAIWYVQPIYNSLSREMATTSSIAPAKNTLACINSLPDSIKIGQKLMLAGYSDQLGDETPVFANADIGGVIVMNEVTAAQLSNVKKAMSIAPFVAVDQEGGTIQRYRSEGSLPGASDMARSFSADQAYGKYLEDDKYLKQIGITTNFSPVVDVISGSQNPLPGRMYSSDPGTVADYAAASIRAANDSDIMPVIKHFPGLGSASGNTDYGGAVTAPLATLRTRDLLPYQRLVARHPDVMVSNAIVPGLTGGQPAVWSSKAVKLLRDMGYQQAVVYSDSLTAQAVPGTLAGAVIKTWQAGVDVAVVVQTKEQTPQLRSYLNTIISSADKALKSGTLKREELSKSIARIFARKGIDACQVTRGVSAEESR